MRRESAIRNSAAHLKLLGASVWVVPEGPRARRPAVFRQQLAAWGYVVTEIATGFQLLSALDGFINQPTSAHARLRAYLISDLSAELRQDLEAMGVLCHLVNSLGPGVTTAL
jgi:hypothetical protein